MPAITLQKTYRSIGDTLTQYITKVLKKDVKEYQRNTQYQETSIPMDGVGAKVREDFRKAFASAKPMADKLAALAQKAAGEEYVPVVDLFADFFANPIDFILSPRLQSDMVAEKAGLMEITPAMVLDAKKKGIITKTPKREKVEAETIEVQDW